MVFKFIKRKLYAGTYVYIYGVKDRYWKICVDKKPKTIQVFKEDLRDKSLYYTTSKYIFKGEFKTFKQAKQFIKEAA